MEHNPSRTAAYLAGAIDEYVKFQGRDTIMRNVARDRRARYARIPAPDACDFCKMLGSRGFVYHSEASASSSRKTGEQYHRFCNCQIAVCFDPAIDEYYVGLTKVTRGYGDGILVRPGADGSHELREVDIDALYDSYKEEMARHPLKSRLHDYSAQSRLSDEEFEAAMQRLSDARTLDELHEAGREIEASWPKGDNGRDEVQWNEMSRHAQRLEREMKTQKDLRVESPYFDNKMKGDDVNYWTVDYSAVEKKSYRDKFDGMPFNNSVCDSLHKESIGMLKDRDGQNSERLVAINARTGKRVASNYMDEAKQGYAQFNAVEEEKVRACKDGVLLLHNHPNSTYPSAADIISCCQHHASGSVVACHDGDVYLITVNEMFFPRDGERSIIAIRFDELYEKAKERTSDAKQAKNAALALLEAENEVKRWYKITKL